MSMKPYYFRASILFILVFLVMFLHGQKVGLVLSGGGAKGVVHVGVIKALEEIGIPVDYITGTSMGAIVGGLYASGYSPAEIEAIMVSEDFSRWATGELQKQYIYYFKEDRPDASWASISFDYDARKNKMISRLPTNLISPSEMDFEFMQFFCSASAAARYDFDSLMIPFRCVASDIENSRAVILSEGQLGRAVRASMTFPFYFKPIELDSMLLFDGGMYNNFPADVMMEDFHPDVIIGSKAAGNYDAPEQDDILSQIQNMLVAKTDYSVIPENGILLEHQLGRVNIVDFSRTQEFIDSGYIMTMRHRKELEDLIEARTTSWEQDFRRELFDLKKPAYLIDSIIISGLNKAQSRYVTQQLKHKAEIITLEELTAEYFKLVADNKISYIFPQMIFQPATGFYNLHLEMKPADKFRISFGGSLGSSVANEAYVELMFKHLGYQAYTTSANVYFGRFYTSAQGKTRIDFASKNPFMLEGGFTYNFRDYFKNTVRFYEDPTPSYLRENESLFWLDGGVPVKNTGKLLGGGEVVRMKEEYYQTNYFTRTDTADITYFDFVSPRLLMELNSLNHKQYANRGARFLLSLRYINGREKNIPGSTSIDKSVYIKYHQWFQFRMIWDDYFKRLGRFGFGFYSELLISNQPRFHNYTSTILLSPAFEPIPESMVLFLPKYRSHNFVSVGLKSVTKIVSKVNFRLEVYIFQPYREIIQMPDQTVEFGKPFSDRSLMGTAALVWHSPLGPLSLSLNYYDRANDRFSIFLNFGYILFNRSSFD